jgi:2',3'-cyclic-nucleotide 2'-phosphodiesterase (5'-nucleotidase family)
MRCLVTLVCLFVSFLGLVFANPVSLRILHLNGLPHGKNQVQGMNVLENQFKRYRKTDLPCLTTFSGDFIPRSSNATSAMNILRRLEMLNVNVGTIGNRDLESGGDHLKNVLESSKFEWISTNVLEMRTGENLIHPYVVYEIQGMKLCVLGFLDPNSHRGSSADDVFVDDPRDCARQVVNKMKGSVDLFVAISHMNAEQDAELGALFPEIKVILGKHSSVQGKTYRQNLVTVLDVTFDKSSGSVMNIKHTTNDSTAMHRMNVNFIEINQ